MTDRSAAMRRYLAEERLPVVPRDSATVLLLRDGVTNAGGIEVFMLRRHHRMSFAPGVFVYPGGAVEHHDQLPTECWTGPSPAQWARALDATPALAEALVCAAIRETFEECGVLLAGPDPQTTCNAEDAAWDGQRLALARGETTLAALLRRGGLVARTDLLRPLGRWITPVFSSRRYDTRFFVAALPLGAGCRDFQEESDSAAWLPVRETLARYERRDIPMMLATADALGAVARHDTVAAVLAAAPPSMIRRIVRGIPEGDGFRWVVDGPDEGVPIDDFLRTAHRV